MSTIWGGSLFTDTAPSHSIQFSLWCMVANTGCELHMQNTTLCAFPALTFSSNMGHSCQGLPHWQGSLLCRKSGILNMQEVSTSLTSGGTGSILFGLELDCDSLEDHTCAGVTLRISLTYNTYCRGSLSSIPTCSLPTTFLRQDVLCCRPACSSRVGWPFCSPKHWSEGWHSRHNARAGMSQ